MFTVLGTIRFDQFWLAFESFESREQYWPLAFCHSWLNVITCVANVQNGLSWDTSSIRDRIDQDAFKRTENIPVWVQDNHTSSTLSTRHSRNLALSWQNSQPRRKSRGKPWNTIPASSNSLFQAAARRFLFGQACRCGRRMAFMVENRRELCTGPFIAGAQRQSNASKNGILLMIVILSAWLRGSMRASGLLQLYIDSISIR